MTIRYALADASGLVAHLGPAATFATPEEALTTLIMTPAASLGLHVVAVDGDFPDFPLPPLPALES